jgi:hypothetical protein
MQLEYEMKPSVNPIAPATPAPPLYRHHHLPITPFVPFCTRHTVHTQAVFVLLFFFKQREIRSNTSVFSHIFRIYDLSSVFECLISGK